MGHDNLVVCPNPARPQYDVEIQHARPPSLATPVAAKMVFDFVEPRKEGRRVKWAGDDSGSIGICAL